MFPWMIFRLQRETVQLVSKISNLCDHNPPTLQMERRMDDMQSQNRALHYSAPRGNNFKMIWQKPGPA